MLIFVIIDSESAKRSGEIQLEDEVTGTSTSGSIRTAGTEEVIKDWFHFLSHRVGRLSM